MSSFRDAPLVGNCRLEAQARNPYSRSWLWIPGSCASLTPRNDKGSNNMLTTANPFDSSTILQGIRRWVEIETPTEAPEQVNKLATLVADGYRHLPVTIERIAGRDGCGGHLFARSGG